MELKFRDKCLALWDKYFDDAELPITFYYTDEEKRAELAKPGNTPRCIIEALKNVRKGDSLSFNTESIACFGGRRYLGFDETVIPNFEYFLSCGIPGKMEGERYKKTPAIVQETMRNMPSFKAPAKYVVFKRWDKLNELDEPVVVVFFAQPDVISGLFTLANYDEGEPNVVYAPFGSGCSSIVLYPYVEKDSSRPRAVIGMFDVSARPHVPENVITLSVPLNRFHNMAENMEESFLITGSWKKVQKRITS